MITVKTRVPQRQTIFREILKYKYIYLMILPGLAVYIVFCYFPMYGLLLAFKTFNARLGILGSHFVGFQNFSFVFRDSAFFNALKNTIVISLSRILFQFPVPIILAILLNELTSTRYRRVLQTVYTFPYFLSWVVIGGANANKRKKHGVVVEETPKAYKAALDEQIDRDREVLEKKPFVAFFCRCQATSWLPICPRQGLGQHARAVFPDRCGAEYQEDGQDRFFSFC